MEESSWVAAAPCANMDEEASSAHASVEDEEEEHLIGDLVSLVCLLWLHQVWVSASCFAWPSGANPDFLLNSCLVDHVAVQTCRGCCWT